MVDKIVCETARKISVREKFLLPTLHMTLTCPQLCSGRQTADDADKHHLVMTFSF